MSQKFISLDDAATKLGVTKDRLNQLREAGDLRAYRDGASWKFRTEDIDKLEQEGVPAEGGDDLTLDSGLGYELSTPDDDLPELEPSESGAGGETDGIDLDDEDIGLAVEPLGDGDDAESILLTGDDEIEGGIPRPQSTIIGKSELSLEDDLQLAAGSDAAPSPPSSGSFEDIEELELDLEAESSRIHQAKAAESGELQLEGDDEIELDLVGSDIDGSDILGQETEVGSGTPGLSGPGSVSGLSGIDKIDLAADEDDDLVLGGSDGSSGDLATSDSGINLSPSDSGFALDEVPLDLGGSAVGSALDLASLSAASGASGLGSAVSGIGGEDFQLTPAEGSDEEEDSSQIVALEEVGEEEDEDMPGFEAIDDGDDGLGAAGFGSGLSAEPSAVVVSSGAAAQEIPFPGWIVVLLGLGFFMMLLSGFMGMELIQSMWAWDEPYVLNSSIMDSLAGLFGG